MKNKRIILERVKGQNYDCITGCFFYEDSGCCYHGTKMPCCDEEGSYVWKEVKQKKEAKNAKSEKE